MNFGNILVSEKNNAGQTPRVLELAGIPSSIEHDHLENKVVEIFNKVRCNTMKENVEACHRIGKNNDCNHQILET